MSEYKTILQDIIFKNECTIEQDAALLKLRNEDTLKYVKSLEKDFRGWVYNELSAHMSDCDNENNLKAHEQRNIFGSVRFSVYSASIHTKAERIEKLTHLFENGNRDHYFLCFHLGRLHLSGSNHLAAYYLYLSANQGYGHAYYLIATNLASEIDKYALLEHAASATIPMLEALYEMGHMRLSGKGCHRDFDIAFSCFERCYQSLATDGAGKDSLFQLSLFYIFGKGSVTQDLKKGYSCLLRAMHLGSTAAAAFYFEDHHRQHALRFIEDMLKQEEILQARNETLEKLVTFNSLDLNAIITQHVKTYLL